MAVTPKIKAELSYIYELNEFKSVQKWLADKQLKIAQQMMQLDMSAPNADKLVAMWQGQYHALTGVLLEWKKLHKEELKD